MEFLLPLIIVGLIVFLIYKRVSGAKFVDTDEMFKQRSVTVDYKAGTIQIGKYTYPVKKVTGISTVTSPGKYTNSYHIKMEFDDMRKPVQLIPVIGTSHHADEFNQRICVALRKAGGPSFS